MKKVAVTTAPAQEPITLSEVKAWAKVDSTDDDVLLTTLITAAREAAESYTRRALISQSIRLTLDLPFTSAMDMLGEGVYDLPVTVLYGDMPKVIPLPRAPVQSITSVTTYDTSNTSTVYSSSNYALITDRLVLNETATWPSPLRQYGACEIVYVAGYGDTGSSVPQGIKTALIMHITAMYDSRIICEMPEQCMRLLRPYRIMDNLAYA